MTINDPVGQHLDLIARWLEGNGYAIDVDYATACIVVWIENWPVVLEIKRQISKGKGQKGKRNAPPHLSEEK